MANEWRILKETPILSRAVTFAMYFNLRAKQERYRIYRILGRSYVCHGQLMRKLGSILLILVILSKNAFRQT